MEYGARDAHHGSARGSRVDPGRVGLIEKGGAQGEDAGAARFDAVERGLSTFVGDVVDWARPRVTNQIVFIAGDFNFELNARNQSNLYSDNLKHDSESYAYLLKFFRDLGRDAGVTTINDRRIDYLFGLPEVALLRRAEVIKPEAIGRMDHLPLLVEVAL